MRTTWGGGRGHPSSFADLCASLFGGARRERSSGARSNAIHAEVALPSWFGRVPDQRGTRSSAAGEGGIQGARRSRDDRVVPWDNFPLKNAIEGDRESVTQATVPGDPPEPLDLVLPRIRTAVPSNKDNLATPHARNASPPPLQPRPKPLVAHDPLANGTRILRKRRTPPISRGPSLRSWSYAITAVQLCNQPLAWCARGDLTPLLSRRAAGAHEEFARHPHEQT
jgi:hypothetical protein